MRILFLRPREGKAKGCRADVDIHIEKQHKAQKAHTEFCALNSLVLRDYQTTLHIQKAN